MGNRLSYIDVTKGLLMLLVIFYHSLCVIMACCSGFVNANNKLLFETPWLFRTYFMVAFFVVSGMVAKFKRPLKEQIINDAKTLLLPSIIICSIVSFIYPEAIDNSNVNILGRLFLYGGGAWFVVAMFVARILYKIILCNENLLIRWIIILSLWGSGCLLDYYIPNEYEYWYLPKAMILTAYFELGKSVQYLDNKYQSWSFLCLLLYLLLTPWLMSLGSITPHLSDTSSVTPKYIPLFGLLSIIGSVAIYELGKIIKHNRVLEFVGRNSLVFYLTHIVFLFVTCSILNNNMTYQGLSIFWSLVLILLLLISALLWSSFFTYLLNTNKFKWILGKF